VIIFRYLTKEILSSLFAVTAILLLIFLSNQLVHYLGDAAAGKLSGQVLLHLMLLQIPYLAGLLLPLGLFLALLLTYGRLCVDNEMVVLSACGFSRGQLILYTMIIAVGVMLVVASLSFWFSPMVLKDIDQVVKKAKSAAIIELLIPGRFRASKDGQQIYYVEQIARDRESMQNIFVAQKTPKNPDWALLFANKGTVDVDAKTGQRAMVFHDGERYMGTPGNKDYRILHFKRYEVPIVEPSALKHHDEETRSIAALWHAGTQNPRIVAELEWRFALPISVILLALLAVPLSQLKPRQGRYAQILPAVFVYAVYANMLFVGREWVEHTKVSTFVGLWGIHGPMLLLSLILLYALPLRNSFSNLARRVRFQALSRINT